MFCSTESVEQFISFVDARITVFLDEVEVSVVNYSYEFTVLLDKGQRYAMSDPVLSQYVNNVLSGP